METANRQPRIRLLQPQPAISLLSKRRISTRAQMKTEDVAQLESALDYHFSNPELLRQALTHSSIAHEMKNKAEVEGSERSENVRYTSAENEQFEFLRDAILDV